MMKRLVLVAVLLLAAVTAAAQSLVRQGSGQYSTPLYNWDGRSVRQGSSRYGTVLYNYDGQYIRKGSSAYSTPILNVSGTVPIAILILIQVM